MLVPLPLVARDASWPASTPLANPLLAYQSRINAKRGHATEARRRLPEDASCKNKRTGSLGMSRDSVLYRSLAYIDTNLCPPQAVLCICHIHIPISPSLSILLLRVSFSSSSVLPFLSSPSHALSFILNRFFLLFIFLSLPPSVRGSPPPCLCVLVSLLVSDQTRLCSSRSLSSFLLVLRVLASVQLSLVLAFSLFLPLFPPLWFPPRPPSRAIASRSDRLFLSRGEFLACIHIEPERVPPSVSLRLHSQREQEGWNWSARITTLSTEECVMYT